MRKVIINCNLINGVDREIVENTFIMIEEEEIVKVGNSNEVPELNDDDIIIDAENQYVLPGLIDAHVHLVWDGSSDPQQVINYLDESTISLRAYSHALETLKLGITTVRDVASPGRSVLNLRDSINQNKLIGPTIIASGPAVCMTGGHVHYLGIEADGPDEVRKATRHVMKEGADLVKVMATGGIYTLGEEPGSVQLTIEELRAAVEEAHKKNLKVAAHADGLEGINNCVEVGIDTIEHSIYADEEVLIKMKEQGTYIVPTMVVMERLATSEEIPAWALEKAKEVVKPQREMLKNAIRLGVKIATGTDCGSPATPPEYYFDELTIMEELGMSSVDVIHASTSVAAECLGITDRGVISEGKKADLLIVSENPLEDLSSLRGPKQVMKNGEFIS